MSTETIPSISLDVVLGSSGRCAANARHNKQPYPTWAQKTNPVTCGD